MRVDREISGDGLVVPSSATLAGIYPQWDEYFSGDHMTPVDKRIILDELIRTIAGTH